MNGIIVSNERVAGRDVRPIPPARAGRQVALVEVRRADSRRFATRYPQDARVDHDGRQSQRDHHSVQVHQIFTLFN